MGFLRSVLGKDWGAELDRAEALLEAGDAVQALEIARRARKKGAALAPRAAKLAAVAMDGVRDLAIANSATAEAKGDLQDAIEWLDSAVLHESDDAARSEFALKIQQLRDRIDGLGVDESVSVGEIEQQIESADDLEMGIDEAGVGLDLQTSYEMLVDTVAEPLQSEYRSRAPEFQQALIDLNEGRAAAALEVLDPLAQESPDDGVLRLETGRARWFLGDGEGALADLDAAWSQLGDQGLDSVDRTTVSLLWAELAFELNRDAEVVERLRRLADLEGESRVGDCYFFARALVDTESYEEAEPYLRSAMGRLPNSHEFKFLLTEVLRELDREPEAVELLEEIVSVGCLVGCSRDQIFPPAFWSLAGIYARTSGQLERSRELLVMGTNFQSGQLKASNYSVMESYFEASGDRDSARRCAQEADRLMAIGDDATSRAGAFLNG